MIAGLVTWISQSLKLTEQTSRWIVIAGFVLAALSASVALKSCYDNRIISHHEDEVTREILEDKVVADENASNKRAEDTIRDMTKAQERKDAIDEAEDSKPSDAGIALGCKRLRDQGYDTSNYAECSGR